VSAAFSQDKEPAFYIKVYGGYGLVTPGSTTINPGSPLGIQSGTTGSYSYSNKGLGGGFNDGFGIEKPLNKIFSIGLDFNQLHGKTIYGNYETYPPLSTNINYVTYAGAESASVTSLTPNVSAKIFTKRNYTIYTRLGAIITLKTKDQYTEGFVVAGNGTLANTEDFEETYKYGTSLGLNATVGVRFNLIGPLNGYVEISNNLLAVSPSSSTANAYIVEGGRAENITYNTAYVKSDSGVASSGGSVVNGSGSVYSTDPSFIQHINNVVINVGIAVAIK
jgi:hypothetical protein